MSHDLEVRTNTKRAKTPIVEAAPRQLQATEEFAELQQEYVAPSIRDIGMGRRASWVPVMAALGGGAVSGVAGGVVGHALSDIGAEDPGLV